MAHMNTTPYLFVIVSKWRGLFFSPLLSFLFLLPTTTFAADIVFGVLPLDGDDTHSVTVLLRSRDALNALEGAIIIPPGTEITDISDADSVVTFWISKPGTREGRVTFAGIMPGGFTGEGVLFHLLVTGPTKGLLVDKSKTQLLENDGNGTPASVLVPEPIALPKKYDSPFLSTHADTIPPDPFTPVVARDPEVDNGQPFVVFATRDNGTGIASYAIAYSDKKLSPDDPSLVWTAVDDHAPIPFPADAKYVYTRATDNAGNARFSVIPDPGRVNTWYTFALISGTIGVVFSVYLLIRRRKMSHGTLPTSHP